MKGIVIFRAENKRSKSEGMFPYLYIGEGEFVRIKLENDNPFENNGLWEYDSKKVDVCGELNELNTFIISSIRLDNTCECEAELELKKAECKACECEDAETVEVVEEVIGTEEVLCVPDCEETAENPEETAKEMPSEEEAPAEEEKKDE